MFPRPRYPAQLIGRFIPDVVCKGPGESAYLTFDDGPDPVATPLTLDILDKYSVKASFFFCASDAQRYPELVHRAVAEGHTIGSHGMAHENLLFRSHQAATAGVARSCELIRTITGVGCRLFRPPYGLFRPGLASRLKQDGKLMVLWTYDTQDFLSGGKKGFGASVSQHVSAKSILLLHSNQLTGSMMKQYLPELIESLGARNVSLAALPQTTQHFS